MKNRLLVLALLALCFAACLVSATVVDFSTITDIAAKGRVQDKNYNPKLTIVHDLVERGKSSIPILIEMLDDDEVLPNCEIPLWHEVQVGDLSLIILTDLFTDRSWEKTTLPNMSWTEILEIKEPSDLTAEQQLRDFVNKYGRSEIKKRWLKAWSEFNERIYWDSSQNCFVLKPIS